MFTLIALLLPLVTAYEAYYESDAYPKGCTLYIVNTNGNSREAQNAAVKECGFLPSPHSSYTYKAWVGSQITWCPEYGYDAKSVDVYVTNDKDWNCEHLTRTSQTQCAKQAAIGTICFEPFHLNPGEWILIVLFGIIGLVGIGFGIWGIICGISYCIDKRKKASYQVLPDEGIVIA